MERSLVIIQPEALAHEADILRHLSNKGFKILQKKRTQLTKDQATDLFQEFIEEEEYPKFIAHLSSSTILGLLVSKPNVHTDLKLTLGHSDPAQAKKADSQSLRALYGIDAGRNGIYASSPITAEREIAFFFPDTYIESVPSMEAARPFLESAVYPTLRQGLTELCKAKPADPTAWLGAWMLANNPNKPRVEEPVA